MLKKILLTFFIFILNIFTINISSADFMYTENVEDVFSDISSDYKYLDELQILYENGMIKPDVNGKFNPRALLSRDEFVGIVMEVTCNECIQPNTVFDFINKYEHKQTFFDVAKANKYFYCVEDANARGYIKGYYPGSKCDNGDVKLDEAPFCPSNTIILEEAIAIILRSSGILTNLEAEKIRTDIYNGVITKNLSDDVSPKNLDGNVYSFYPDFKKALEYEVMDVDTDGNITISTMLEVIDGKLRPKQAVTKEDFLRIAYITLKATSCDDKNNNDLPLEIIIYDKSCDENKENCTASDLDDPSNTYDFTGKVDTMCEDGIDEPDGYIWRFYNEDTGEEIKKYGKYIDDYKFLSSGKWTIFLRVVDNCGDTTEVYTTFYINTDSGDDNELDLKALIIVDKIDGELPLVVNFKGIASGGAGQYTYSWDFGDGNNGLGKTIKNIFKEEGVFEVTLMVTDKTGNKITSTVSIDVIGTNDELPLKIIVYDKSCDDSMNDCDLSSLDDLDNEYDFSEEVYTMCSAGISEPEGYIWKFYNEDTGEEIKKYGKYIDNYKFLSSGKWIIFLRIIDNCGDTIESYTTFYINIDTGNEDEIEIDLKVFIDANPITGEGPLSIDFEGIVSGGDGQYTYSWDFGDGNTGNSQIINNIYNDEGLFEVNLSVTDGEGNMVETLIFITVEGFDECSMDNDGDGVNDCDDMCTTMEGDIRNDGCPILEPPCADDLDCDNGSYCDMDTMVCLPKLLEQSCEYTGGDAIFGNIICNTCPCDNYLDFISTLRRCDFIFPAITSRDSKIIYSKGALFEIEE